VITHPDIESAAWIRAYVRETPVAALEKGVFGLDARLVLK